MSILIYNCIRIQYRGSTVINFQCILISVRGPNFNTGKITTVGYTGSIFLTKFIWKSLRQNVQENVWNYSETLGVEFRTNIDKGLQENKLKDWELISSIFKINLKKSVNIQFGWVINSHGRQASSTLQTYANHFHLEPLCPHGLRAALSSRLETEMATGSQPSWCLPETTRRRRDWTLGLQRSRSLASWKQLMQLERYPLARQVSSPDCSTSWALRWSVPVEGPELRCACGGQPSSARAVPITGPTWSWPRLASPQAVRRELLEWRLEFGVVWLSGYRLASLTRLVHQAPLRHPCSLSWCRPWAEPSNYAVWVSCLRDPKTVADNW